MTGTTTYTPLLRITQPGVGAPSVRNAWGALLDTDMQMIENAITGVATITLTGSTYTVTSANGAADSTNQAGYSALLLTGSPSGGVCTVTIPSVVRFGLVKNISNAVVTLTTGSGLTLVLAANTYGFPANDFPWVAYYCDGTNVLADTYASRGTAGVLTQGTTGTTWTVPPGVSFAKFTLQGSGNQGGSGYANSSAPTGGGGGGGGGAFQVYFPVNAGEVFTFGTPANGTGYNATLANALGDVNIVASCGGAGIFGFFGGGGGAGGGVTTTGTTRLYIGQALSGQAGGQGYYVNQGGNVWGVSGAGGPSGIGASGGTSTAGPYTNSTVTAVNAPPGAGGAGGVGSAVGQPGGTAYAIVEV